MAELSDETNELSDQQLKMFLPIAVAGETEYTSFTKSISLNSAEIFTSQAIKGDNQMKVKWGNESPIELNFKVVEPTESKLSVQFFRLGALDGANFHIKPKRENNQFWFSGFLSENADFSALAVADNNEIKIDLSGLTGINSSGILNLVKHIRNTKNNVVYQNCPAFFVEQVFCVPEVLSDNTTVESFFEIYSLDDSNFSGSETLVRYDVKSMRKNAKDFNIKEELKIGGKSYSADNFIHLTEEQIDLLSGFLRSEDNSNFEALVECPIEKRNIFCSNCSFAGDAVFSKNDESKCPRCGNKNISPNILKGYKIEFGENDDKTLLRLKNLLVGRFNKSRREDVRILPENIKISFEISENNFPAHLKNISKGGMYVETDQKLYKGQELYFKLQLQGSANTEIFLATVVHIQNLAGTGSDAKMGYGLKFVTYNDEDKERIDKLFDNLSEGKLPVNAADDQSLSAWSIAGIVIAALILFFLISKFQ